MNIVEKIEQYLAEASPEDMAEYSVLKAKRDDARKSGKKLEAEAHDSKLALLRQRIVKADQEAAKKKV
jgi:hypothetical protein